MIKRVSQTDFDLEIFKYRPIIPENTGTDGEDDGRL